ncbi:MAG TPA: SMP-30/gluconolactonase/LRE family protein, partial [Thermomonas sp.]|nr:SMP-30/gluconolactonase/LRE family protein [Thermomonas sp.]
FCDIDAGTIYRIAPDGQPQALYVHGSPVSGWVRLDDGSLLVVAGIERRLVAVRDGVATTFADATDKVGWAINDLLRTPDGHCYVGGIDFNLFADPSQAGKPSPLLHVTPDGRVDIATREIVFANGMTVLPSGELLVADSLTGELLAFTRRADGSLADRRVWAALPGEMLDGICLDADGAVWAASHHQVLRVREGGEVTDVVDMGATRATACMLGGPEGRTLLITASDTHDRAEIRAKGPSGAVYSVRVPVAGSGLPSVYGAAP